MNFIDEAVVALRSFGSEACLCGPSAAFLHHLTFDVPDAVDILVPWTYGIPPELPGIRLRRTRGVARRPPALVPIPHTDILDTVLDLTDRTDAETCIYWLTEATRRSLVTMPQVEAALRERNRHRHRRLITDVAEDVASGATSNLEVRYARDVERRHRLPRAVRQFVVPETGHPVDFAYPGIRLLIEVDGAAFHTGERQERDRWLDEAHERAGYVTRRFGWFDAAAQPCATSIEVASLLKRAGMVVERQPCDREPQ